MMMMMMNILVFGIWLFSQVSGTRTGRRRRFSGIEFGQRPQHGGLVGAGAEKAKVGGMPSALGDLVGVLGHHHALERLGEVTLQVGEHNLVVVAARQQVVGLVREAQRAHIGRVRVEGLDDATAANVVQHALGVLVAGHQQLAGGIDHDRGDRAAT